MPYHYSISFDKVADAWNWFDASHHPIFQGFAWRNNLQDYFLDFFDKLIDLPGSQAKQAINTFLDEIYHNNKDAYYKQEQDLNTAFNQKFNNSCEWLENVTGKPLYLKTFTIYLTTFPRAPYDPEKGYLWFCIWWGSGQLIKTFLHEVLHFQFTYYWRNNPKSPVSQLDNHTFEFIKESLTIVIDDSASHLAPQPDEGYPEHREFRKKLHKYWKQHHNFDKLVDYSLKIVSDYAKA